MTSSNYTLNDARVLYSGASVRAGKAWRLLNELAAKRVWLAVEAATDTAASNIYYNAGYSASETYESLEDFKEALVEDLRAEFRIVEIAGVPAYEVLPYFASNGDSLRHFGLGSTSPCRVDEFKGLDVARFSVDNAWNVVNLSGVTTEEVTTLVNDYGRRTLSIVNLLRKLRTALAYLEATLAPDSRYAKAHAAALNAEPVEDLLDALITECTLNFEPPCPTYFSSDDGKFTVRSLESPEGCLALRSAAEFK